MYFRLISINTFTIQSSPVHLFSLNMNILLQNCIDFPSVFWFSEHISAPSLSFTVFSNDSRLTANISCRSERGSPPVTFSLMLDGQELDVKRVDSLESWFVLPVSVGLDLGAARCKAQTDTQQLISDPVRLLVGEFVSNTEHLSVDYNNRLKLTIQFHVYLGVFWDLHWEIKYHVFCKISCVFKVLSND